MLEREGDNEECLECGRALCLRDKEGENAWKGACTLFTSQREREKEKERVFIFKRNDGCLGTF